MKVQVLCSTMYGVKPLFFNKGYKPIDSIIVNQCDKVESESPEYLNFYEKGISKSRNRGLEHAKSEICLITDNDTYFNNETIRIIENSFLAHPDADILTFQVETPEGRLYKEYGDDFFWHNRLSLAKVSSVEIAFRRKIILENNIIFDEDFGLGSYYPTSEEYIFLVDALDKGLKIGYIPEVIVYHPKESSGGDFSNKELVYAKGAMISRVFGVKGILICFLFSLKKYKYSSMNFLSFLKLLCAGYFKYQMKANRKGF